MAIANAKGDDSMGDCELDSEGRTASQRLLRIHGTPFSQLSEHEVREYVRDCPKHLIMHVLCRMAVHTIVPDLSEESESTSPSSSLLSDATDKDEGSDHQLGSRLSPKKKRRANVTNNVFHAIDEYAFLDPTKRRVFVRGLNRDITEMRLRRAFEHLGSIDDSTIIYEKDSGKSKGYGFITFGNSVEASKVVKLEHVDIEGKRCQTSWAGALHNPTTKARLYSKALHETVDDYRRRMTALSSTVEEEPRLGRDRGRRSSSNPRSSRRDGSNRGGRRSSANSNHNSGLGMGNIGGPPPLKRARFRNRDSRIGSGGSGGSGSGTGMSSENSSDGYRGDDNFISHFYPHSRPDSSYGGGGGTTGPPTSASLSNYHHSGPPPPPHHPGHHAAHHLHAPPPMSHQHPSHAHASHHHPAYQQRPPPMYQAADYGAYPPRAGPPPALHHHPTRQPDYGAPAPAPPSMSSPYGTGSMTAAGYGYDHRQMRQPNMIPEYDPRYDSHPSYYPYASSSSSSATTATSSYPPPSSALSSSLPTSLTSSPTPTTRNVSRVDYARQYPSSWMSAENESRYPLQSSSDTRLSSDMEVSSSAVGYPSFDRSVAPAPSAVSNQPYYPSYPPANNPTAPSSQPITTGAGEYNPYADAASASAVSMPASVGHVAGPSAAASSAAVAPPPPANSYGLGYPPGNSAAPLQYASQPAATVHPSAYPAYSSAGYPPASY